MIPHDADHERSVIAWVAIDPDARETFFNDLEPVDFWLPELRDLFVVLRRLYLDGRLHHTYEIRGTALVHVWENLDESRRAELSAIVGHRDVGIYVSELARSIVDDLRRHTKERAIVVAAQKILAGMPLADDVIDWLAEGIT